MAVERASKRVLKLFGFGPSLDEWQFNMRLEKGSFGDYSGGCFLKYTTGWIDHIMDRNTKSCFNYKWSYYRYITCLDFKLTQKTDLSLANLHDLLNGEMLNNVEWTFTQKGFKLNKGRNSISLWTQKFENESATSRTSRFCVELLIICRWK